MHPWFEQIQLQRFLVSFCLILLFSGSFLLFQEQNSDVIIRVATEQLKGNFYLAVANIRMRHQQQGAIEVVSYQGRKVKVNRLGKPQVLNDKGHLQCKAIWQQVMGDHVTIGSENVAAQRLYSDETGTDFHQGCRFFATDDAFIDYFP